jgi:hypothetical protein
VPAKRALVHMSCVACGEPMPLGAVATAVACAACGWKGTLDGGAWRWVLEPGARTVAGGETILGETTACVIQCAGCKTVFDESAVARAFSTGQATLVCASCTQPMPMRPAPPMLVEEACALIAEGEGEAASRSEGPINVACSNCGARLDADGSTPAPVCSFCGTRNPLPADVWKRLHPPGQVHPFYVWSPRAAARAAASSTSAEPPVRRSSNGNVIVGVIGIVVAVVAVVAGLLQHSSSPSKKRSPFVAPNSACDGMKSACSSDRKALLECDDGKLVLGMTCRGPKGCRATDHGKSVSCDYTLAEANDPCNVKDSACSTDGKTELRCDGAKFVVASPCNGPDGCTVAPSKDGYTLTCDDHVAPPGAPCLDDGRFACSSDMKSLLRCTRGHFVLASACKGPGACSLSKNAVADTTTVSCDGNLADVGDLCQPDRHACTPDGKAMLACESGRFAIAERCAGGCVLKHDGLECRRPRR